LGTDKRPELRDLRETFRAPMIVSCQEGSVELIYELDRWRLQRELRRRESALHEAAQAPRAAGPEPKDAIPAADAGLLKSEEAAVAKPEAPVAQGASNAPGRWECSFCGRGFHGYGQFLNHNCHNDY
jgi:hypothetical protein